MAFKVKCKLCHTVSKVNYFYKARASRVKNGTGRKPTEFENCYLLKHKLTIIPISEGTLN